MNPRKLPAAFESGDRFADRSPPGIARSNLDPRKTSLRWTSQQPSKLATVSQIAAPPGCAKSNLSLRSTAACWTPQQPSKAATVSQFAAPGHGGVSF